MAMQAMKEGAVVVEMLDIVDAHNRVIGCAPRREVHRLGLRHRAVHMLIQDGEGRIYLQRRSPLKDVDPNLWDTSAAGHVDRGEDYLAAARRELEEELGLTDVDLQALCDLPARPETGEEFVRVYIGRSAREPRPDPREIAAGGWWPVAELTQWLAREPALFTATFKQIYAEFLARGARHD
jgi:isopentenyldiphosphate isomerase